jgi:hypothetical protein
MLHSALARALATARIEDQVRAAARWHTIRLARRTRATRGGDLQSPDVDPRQPDYVDCARPGPRHDTSRDSPSDHVTMPIRRRRRLRRRAAIHQASSEPRSASSHTRTSRGSE